MTKRATVNINIDKLNDIAHLGVRRAALFMGIGLNAAAREDFLDYELHKLPITPDQTSLLMDFFPSDLPADRVRTFKEEFATWITGCGLRELLEHYAMFLDRMHHDVLLVLCLRRKLQGQEASKNHREFRGLGIPGKLRLLQERFAISPTVPERISSLYVARNCLTHDLGVVTPKRCSADGHLNVMWNAFEVFGKGENSGKEWPSTRLIGMTTEEPIVIYSRYVARERKFAAGTRLVLSKQDLAEICHFFGAHAIPSAVTSFVTFLEAHQIPIEKHERQLPKAASGGPEQP